MTGDSGYGLEPWLMTPITDAPDGSAEARYTQNHTSTRNCVERMFGLLKNVWRCLLRHRVLHYKPVVASYIITTCAILHNIRLDYNVIDVEFDIDEEDEAELFQRNIQPRHIAARDRIRMQAQEIIGDEVVNYGDRLREAKRVQRRILRTQFGLREEE